MVKRDLDKAASRFLNALRRTGAGLQKQRERILDQAANAPRLLPDSPYEFINLTGDDGNDPDYYIYELARLQDLGKSIIKSSASRGSSSTVDMIGTVPRRGDSAR